MSVNSCKINKMFFRNINELWIYVTIWMNLQSLKLSERRHAQKTAYSMIPIILYFHYGIGTNIGKGLNVCWGLIIELLLTEKSTGKLLGLLGIFYIIFYGCGGDYRFKLYFQYI